MSLRTLFDLGMSYAIFGGMIFLIFLALFLIGYYFIYKKLSKKQHTLSFPHILWWGVFLCYVFVVLGVTLFIRGETLTIEPVYPLFYSYRDAWYHWSSTSWSNIILNFCMFVPLGFLLPLGLPFFRKEWRVFLSGFAFSLFIELTQLLTRRGMFEWDDLLGNTIGTLIGYGFYLLLIWLGHYINKARLRRKNIILADAFVLQGKAGSLKVLLAQFPLVITICAFAIIFLKYKSLEIGISPDSYILPYDSSRIHLSSELSLSDNAADGMVYSADVLTPDMAIEFGERFFSNLGTHVNAKNARPYENLIALSSEDGKRSLWVDYKGGTFQYTDYSLLFPSNENADTPIPVKNATLEEITQALLKYGISLPDASSQGLTFRELSGNFHEDGWYEITIDPIAEDDDILLGSVSCQYYGEAGLGSISNQISKNKSYKKYPLLSEQEAYEQIAAGKFDYYGRDALDIKLQSCSLIYVIDSKGYFQPTYEFHGTLNGMGSSIRIPALLIAKH